MKKRCIISLITAVYIAVLWQCPIMASGDKYANFAELAENEVEGEDYRIEYTDMGTDLLVLSPHGGIEGESANWCAPSAKSIQRICSKELNPRIIGICTLQAVILMNRQHWKKSVSTAMC